MTHERISEDGRMTGELGRWTLQWQAGQEPVEVEHEDRLMKLLGEAEEDAVEQPLVVELRAPDGAALTIGLGQEVSVATFAASAEPPYYVSDGGGGDETLVFFRDGHWSEFGPEAAISHEAARETARRFFATGVRPSNIEWSEV